MPHPRALPYPAEQPMAVLPCPAPAARPPCSSGPFAQRLPVSAPELPSADSESEGSIAELLEHRSDTYYAFTAVVKAGLLKELSSE